MLSCSVTGGGQLRVTVTVTVAGRGGLPACRRGWLATELDFLARMCPQIPPADLATLLQRYVSAAVLTEAGYRGGAVVEAAVTAGAPGAANTCCAPVSQPIRLAPSWDAFTVEHKPFGWVVVVHELAGIGVYLLRIGPGGTIPWHVHRVMQEAELVLGTGLLLQGRPVPRGLAVRWPGGHPHSYHNPTSEVQTVLCVDRPAFIPDDEIEVPPPEVPAFPAAVTLHRPGGTVAR